MEGTPGVIVARMILINALTWAAVQLSLAWLAERLDADRLARNGLLFHPKSWESNFYRTLGVRIWKGWLPNGGPWVGGRFSKLRLEHYDSVYLRRFAVESYRGELAHWWMIAVLPLFFLWNPLKVWPILLGYVLVANMPCIITQRYNRSALLSILWKKSKPLRG